MDMFFSLDRLVLPRMYQTHPKSSTPPRLSDVHSSYTVTKDGATVVLVGVCSPVDAATINRYKTELS